MHCPLCNSKNNINFQKSTKGLIFVKNKFHKFKTTKTICKNCHHIFNSKKLPKNLMAKNYVTRRENKIWKKDNEYKNSAKYYKGLAKFIMKNKIKKKKFLDIGCGPGYLLAEMTKYIPKNDVWGIDMSLNIPQLVPAKLKKNIIVGNFESKHFDIKFNTIALISVFEHFYNLKRPLIKINNLLESDGIFCIVVPNSKYILNDKNKGLLFMHDVMSLEHLHHFSEINLTKFIEKFGFKLINKRKSKQGIWNTLDLIFKKTDEITNSKQVYTKMKSEQIFKKLNNVKNSQKICSNFKVQQKKYSLRLNKILKNKTFSIYGCGWWTNTVLTNFFNLNTKNLIHLFDNDNRKINKKIFNTKIEKPNSNISKSDILLISTLNNASEIKQGISKKYLLKKSKIIDFTKNKAFL